MFYVLFLILACVLFGIRYAAGGMSKMDIIIITSLLVVFCWFIDQQPTTNNEPKRSSSNTIRL